MITLPAIYYDGQTSDSQSVELRFEDTGKVRIAGSAISSSYELASVKAKPRVGKLPAQFIFPGGAVCEVNDHPELEAAIRLLPGRSWQDIVHKIENNLVAISLSLLLTVVLVFVVVQYGIPFGAKQVAFKIPIELENRMGRDALAFFDKTLCEPSKLPPNKRQHTEKVLLEALSKMDIRLVQLQFRDCEKIGANAFALPSGIIIITDEMVTMAKEDDELIGVLAHEVGHVRQRHIMRQLLQNSVTGLLLVMLTGDVGTASSLAAALPTLLLQTKFSRDFETEADEYAARYLQSVHISPKHLANLLQRLARKNTKGESNLVGFLSSHPLTAERIKRLRNY